jgi:hypothetical protein
MATKRKTAQPKRLVTTPYPSPLLPPVISDEKKGYYKWPTIEEREAISELWQRHHHTGVYTMPSRAPLICAFGFCCEATADVFLCKGCQKDLLGLEIKESKVHGKGLFATRDIPKFMPLDIYRGSMSYTEPSATGDRNYLVEHTGKGTNGRSIWVDGRVHSSLARFANSSTAHETANAVVADARISAWLKGDKELQAAATKMGITTPLSQWHPEVGLPVLFSRVNIAAGDEIRFYYGEMFFRPGELR